MFINPDYQWNIPQQKRIPLAYNEPDVFVNEFVTLIKRDPVVGRNKIRRYVMKIKKRQKIKN